MRRLALIALAVLLLLDSNPLGPAGPPRPSPDYGAAGYHHLGATSVDPYTGVLGRIAVTDPGVRAGTYDFVAARFMAKKDHSGRTDWLEAGWTETGWSGGGRQRVYTFDTVHNAWTFYDQYPIRAGDRIWIYLETSDTGPNPVWHAWLWWADAWHLLAALALPLDGGAQQEQYVEVYVDPARGGTIPVPRISTDNVQLRPAAGGPLGYWRDPDVRTTGGVSTDTYCLDWQVTFDTWSAGDCPA
ncbi:MAG TPA: hypothetical protein VFE14_09450 [Micromonosporaceae bacterium]|jgi:hypothetical protein|nr:hypothetical protein [Micromonosporaceae bacterium]